MNPAADPRPLVAAVERGSACMRRRGPDAQGLIAEAGAILAHRRLAILDLDPRSDQPMTSDCGRWVITFNGEIYNFRSLRSELEHSGVRFRTASDTEVLLALFARQGEAMLPRLIGMFAFAIWDRVTRRAFVARDPYGIKPLYVANTAEGVLLGSQVRALMASGLVSQEPDPLGQALFWMLGSVPEPHTWFRDVRALPAGHCAWIESGVLGPTRSWHDLGAAWRAAEQTRLAPAEVGAVVREALLASVRRHLVSDVPVGVFLSGGIDSGALAGLMVEAGARELEGITLAYDEFTGRPDDEAPAAARIAAHYGIRHTVRRVSREEFLTDLPRIQAAMDQPSLDGINTWYASKAVAERGLKVVVSGVGGDELFQGYGSFTRLPRVLAWRRACDGLPGASAALSWLGALQARRTGKRRWRHLEPWTRDIAGLWWLNRSVSSPEELPDFTRDGTRAWVQGQETAWVRQAVGSLPQDPRLALGQIESMTYLRNQLLRDSDWASMDHSIELRTPLVDVALLQQLTPVLGTLATSPPKRLLAEAPARPLPLDILMRPKTGFGIPVSTWLAARACLAPGWTWAQELADSYGEDGAFSCA